jgi:2-polyprenyl-6-methoxyphenol hydroxylase-like FAD-dependent oxidoreductase
MQETKALLVGAGVAGLSLAIMLAGQNINRCHKAVKF